MSQSDLRSGRRGRAAELIAWMASQPGQLSLLLALALGLRLAFVFSRGPEDFLSGGDGPWYIQQGWLIAHRSLITPLATVGPLYPLILAAVWGLFPSAPLPVEGIVTPAGFLTIVRLLQVVLGVFVAWLGYRLARGLGGRHEAGMIAAFGLGIGPAFVIEPIYILTEQVFMALLVLWAWLYFKAVATSSTWRLAGAGVALALAGWTRPVILLLPVVLIPHLILVDGGVGRAKRLVTFLGAVAVVVLPWSLYLYVATGSFAPQGFLSNLWIGAVGMGRWEGALATDQLRFATGANDAGYAREAFRIITSDPLHWLALRAGNLAAAILTPHGTSDLAGPSIKQLFGAWLSGDRSASGLLAIAGSMNFALKLAVYIFHYFALALGLLGACVSIRRWRQAYGLYAVIGCLVAVHALLTVLPRYLFPAEPFLWVFAAMGLVWARDRYVHRRETASGTGESIL